MQDPVVHYDFSPYNAFDNDPVFWADPSGADSSGANDNFHGFDMDGNSKTHKDGILYVPLFERGLGRTISSTGGGTNYYGTANVTPLELALLAKSVLDNTLHDDMQEGSNRTLAKQIAKLYGYDNWREIEAFLDANPFELTHKGVAMGGKEALSSKYIEDDKTVIDYVQDEAISQIQGKIIECFSPRAGKILDLGGQLLSTQSAHAPDSNYLLKQYQRIEECKSTLIRYYFERPATYQTPSIHNDYQNAQYHSSRFDIMHHRYF